MSDVNDRRHPDWLPTPKLVAAAERLTAKFQSEDWFVRCYPVAIANANPGHTQRLVVEYRDSPTFKGEYEGGLMEFEGFPIYYHMPSRN